MEKSFLGNIYDQLHEESTSDSLIGDLAVSDGRYCHLELINQGGMKEIYSATDVVTDRTVALAVLPLKGTSEELQNLFIREARLNAFLQHPGIARVYDIGILQDGRPFFATKLLRGINLQEVIDKKEEPYSLDQLIDIFLRVAEATSYAHAHGVIHRDIKPENILVGEFDEVTLCDWGLAEICNEVDTPNESIFDKDLKNLMKYKLPQDETLLRGSPGFISPERYSKPHAAQPSMDIYSLGALLYVILTKETLSIPGNFSAPKELNPNIPESLNAICQKSLLADNRERYQNTEEMIKDIRRYRHGYATEAEKPSSLRLLKLLYLRNKLLFHSAVIIVIILAIALVRITQSRNQAIVEKKKAEDAKEHISELFDELSKKEQLNKIQYSDLEYQWALNKLNNGFYKKGMVNIEKAIEFNPENQHALKMKGLMAFASFKWDNAKEILKERQGNKNVIHFIDNLPKDSNKAKMAAIEYCDKNVVRPVYKFSLLSGLESDLDFPSKCQLYKKHLAYLNNLKKIAILYNEKYSMTIQCNRRTSLGRLDLLELKILNLTGESVRDLEILKRCKSIETLDLSELQSFSLNGVRLTNLKHLVLAKVDPSSADSVFKIESLETLSLDYIEERQLKQISSLPNLSKLNLHIKQKSIVDMWLKDKTIDFKIEYYR